MSINKYIKEKENIDITYQMFKDKNNINIKEELFLNNKNKQNIFKAKPFKLSIALTILLLIISITIIGVNNIDNKYKHYQLYEKGDELNEIMEDKNDIQGNEVGGSPTRILETLNGICLFIKEYTIFEIKDSSFDYYICGYVDSEVKEKVYKTYHLDTSQYYSTSFYYDSLFHAYTLCTSDNFLCSLDEVKRDLYFSKDDYPITWYMVKKDKDIFEYIEDKFLLGVFEIKEAIFEGIVSHKTKTKQIFCEKYEYRIEEMNPIERTTNRYVKETIYSLDYERINVNEEKKYINYCGWSKISNLDFLLEKDINISKISEIKYYNDIAYINLGDETVVTVYNEEYSFQDSVNCFYDCFVIAEELINKCEHEVYFCEDCYISVYNEKHSGCKCQDKDYLNSLKKDFKDMYEYKTIIKNTKQYYYFKLYDFLSFIEVNNHYDMYTFLNPLDMAIENF